MYLNEDLFKKNWKKKFERFISIIAKTIEFSNLTNLYLKPFYISKRQQRLTKVIYLP